MLALNAAHVAETSHLDETALRALRDQAFLAAAVTGPEGLSAFLIALDQDAAYASPNFRWFRERYPRFVYVDRIVTAPAARAAVGWRGRSTGPCSRGPPRPATTASPARSTACRRTRAPTPSAALGFAEVGSADIHGGTKTVRYLMRETKP